MENERNIITTFFALVIILLLLVGMLIFESPNESNHSNEAWAGVNPTPTTATIHHGTPHNGSMEYDVQMTNTTGIWVKNSSRSYTGDKIRNCLEELGRAWATAYPTTTYPPIQITEISPEHGGPFPTPPNHLSHKNGLDLDFRYLRNDTSAPQEMKFPDDEAHYDHDLTQDLIDRLNNLDCDAQVQLIGAASAANLSGVQTWLGHNDHFHVRFVDPDGTSN